MSVSHHTHGFEACRFILSGLAAMDAEDRSAVFEGLRVAYCMFCGKRHPEGRCCTCWQSDSEVLSMIDEFEKLADTPTTSPPRGLQISRMNFRDWASRLRESVVAEQLQ